MGSRIDDMKNLLKAGNICVLATCAEGRPHCSLMAYVCDDGGTTVYMATLKQTQKYRNLLRNPQASLLVDTRIEQQSSGRSGIQALTASGSFQALTEAPERQQIFEKIAARHPHLEDLLRDEDAEPFAIMISSFLLLDGPLEAQYLEL